MWMSPAILGSGRAPASRRTQQPECSTCKQRATTAGGTLSPAKSFVEWMGIIGVDSTGFTFKPDVNRDRLVEAGKRRPRVIPHTKIKGLRQ
jgi:hypothetical protein